MKKLFLFVICNLFFVNLFCAELKAKDVVNESQKMESVEESISYIKKQISVISVPAEKRALYIFLANLQEQLAMFDDAKMNYASAAGISASNAEGMTKKSNEQLVLDAVRCALSSGDYVTADNYLNSAVRNSKNDLIQCYIKLYAQWSSLCRAESKEELLEPIEILKAYSKVSSMEKVKPVILLTLWYVTGENDYAKQITSLFPSSTEAAIVKGDAQLLPTPFWFFVPKLGEVEMGIGSIAEARMADSENKVNDKTSAGKSVKSTDGKTSVVKLQLGLFKTENNAKLLQEELKKKGFESYITTEKRSSGTVYYIVLVNENSQNTMADKLRSSGYECYVVD